MGWIAVWTEDCINMHSAPVRFSLAISGLRRPNLVRYWLSTPQFMEAFENIYKCFYSRKTVHVSEECQLTA